LDFCDGYVFKPNVHRDDGGEAFKDWNDICYYPLRESSHEQHQCKQCFIHICSTSCRWKKTTPPTKDIACGKHYLFDYKTGLIKYIP